MAGAFVCSGGQWDGRGCLRDLLWVLGDYKGPLRRWLTNAVDGVAYRCAFGGKSGRGGKQAGESRHRINPSFASFVPLLQENKWEGGKRVGGQELLKGSKCEFDGNWRSLCG